MNPRCEKDMFFHRVEFSLLFLFILAFFLQISGTPRSTRQDLTFSTIGKRKKMMRREGVISYLFLAISSLWVFRIDEKKKRRSKGLPRSLLPLFLPPPSTFSSSISSLHVLHLTLVAIILLESRQKNKERKKKKKNKAN